MLRVVDVRPFTRADIPFAAQLLAARGNSHPLAAPIDAAAEIEKQLDDGATGYVAPGGYLVGKVEEDAAWCLYGGHAARDVATYRHLYRAIGRDWVAAGQLRHAIAMPEGDPVAEPAFANLAFGREHVFALAALADQPSDAPDPQIPVRVATMADFPSLQPMFDIVARHLSGPPVWSRFSARYHETLVDEFRADLAKPEVTYLVASVDGEDVGFACWETLPPRIAVPAGAYALGHAAVREDMRGRGVGRALTLTGLALARERGETVTWVDWRLTNMSAEPYWRAYGWTPYNVRYTRCVEPEVSRRGG